MKKIIFTLLSLVLTVGVVYAAAAMSGTGNKTYSWRYKMTVTVETPEGEISGSAVREMSNSTPLISLPDVGNPASVRGEAVVVNMGERGVLFALISSDSDMEFYTAFRKLWPHGGSTPEGIKFYSELPVGTKVELQPGGFRGHPKLVTFTDMNDPKSVTLAQEWAFDRENRRYKKRLKADRMEELFGEGVKLKDITLEITDEPVTWGVVDKYLPSEARKLKMTYSYFSWPNEAALK